MPRAAVHANTIKVAPDSLKAADLGLDGGGDTQHDDEARLRQLGYKQELRRELNLLRNFAVSFGLLSMLTGLGELAAGRAGQALHSVLLRCMPAAEVICC